MLLAEQLSAFAFDNGPKGALNALSAFLDSDDFFSKWTKSHKSWPA
jgi:hypothetical protein